jgi:hypothetical protein
MRYVASLMIFFCLCPLVALAEKPPDSDGDGVSDRDEIEVYNTDPRNRDTDGDGYSDWLELNNGYSPHKPGTFRLEDSDFDNDGLNDRMELNFGSDITAPDTDGDGYWDGEEIANGYAPLAPAGDKLPKRIEIDTGNQALSYFLGGVRMGKYPVSTGKPSMPTPKGYYLIINKVEKARSPYGLWMPYWMGLGTGKFGIHQLPYWPNGYREGEDHLGRAVSHGCIRLGMDPAKKLYKWANVGTPVYIYIN